MSPEGKKFETSNQPDTEKKEEELSPETLELIMRKVQDIDAPGIAYSVVEDRISENDLYGNPPYEGAFDKLDRVLPEGLIGTDYWYGRDISQERGDSITTRKWKENIRKKRKGLVHFNITGRTLYIDDCLSEKGSNTREDDLNRWKPKIAKNQWSVTSGGDSLVILFTLENFKEKEPLLKRIIKDKGEEILNEERFNFKQRVNEYRCASANTQEELKKYRLGKSSETIAEDEFGFALSFRVSPRHFTGLIFGNGEGNYLNWKEQKDGTIRLEIDKEGSKYKKYIEKIKEVAELEKNIFGDKISRYVPIYDIGGNLHWPKEMTYEEVQKFVRERDAKEQEEKEKEDKQS
jgi:hypothetical protein